MNGRPHAQPSGLHDPQKGLWSIANIGTTCTPKVCDIMVFGLCSGVFGNSVTYFWCPGILGYGIWSQFMVPSVLTRGVDGSCCVGHNLSYNLLMLSIF